MELTLDGLSCIDQLIQKAKLDNQPAIAITDHGNMYGIIEFYKQCIKNSIKPIIGVEAYITNNRFERNDNNYHLTLLAKNINGYHNLCKLITSSYLQGYYYKPRLDWELLKLYSKDIICLSGCLSGEVSYNILNNGDYKSLIVDYYQLFGEDYYLEIQPNKIPAQETVNEVLINTGKKLGIPVVVTCDSHYVNKEDHKSHDILLCIQTSKKVSDENRMKMDTEELYLKTAQEVYDYLKLESPIDETINIANKCNIEFKLGKFSFPDSQINNEEKYFEKLVKDKFDLKFPNATNEYIERMLYELDVIKKLNFVGYFLIVYDFINYAKSNNIPIGPARGSSAGSLVAYVLNITTIDPIKHNLIFERFLNPDRVAPPDIDIDINPEDRDEVIQYVKTKYGIDRVAQITTFGSMKSKMVIRDVSRALDIPLKEADKLAKLIPNPKQGFNYSLTEAFKEEPRLRKEKDKYPELFEHSFKLENTIRHASTHAAGVVISNKPLTEYMPLYLDKDGNIVSQFDMHNVEDIGLIKFDFLGLKTLTVIQHSLELINKKIDINNLDLNISEVYELLSIGDTTGIFQLESSGMRGLLTELKPTKFEDIALVLALLRPGVLNTGMIGEYIKRKNGAKFDYLYSGLKPILDNTYGIIVYQEQILQIANKLAGYSLSDADNLRRIIGKKVPHEMKLEKTKFLEGCKKNNIDGGILFDQIEESAKYLYNFSHAISYAMISYQTAYLKTFYPLEFTCALLCSEVNDQDEIAKIISETNIPIKPPDINKSKSNFSVNENEIIFGLSAIKHVGNIAADNIVKNQPYESYEQFLSKIDSRIVNKRVIEQLTNAGVLDRLLNRGISVKERIGREKEFLGCYVTEYPLDQFKEIFRQYYITPIEKVKNSSNLIRIGGIIDNLEKKYTKRNNLYYEFTLNDKFNSLKCVIWPKNLLNYFKNNIKDGSCFCLIGKYNEKYSKLDVESGKLLSEFKLKSKNNILINLPEEENLINFKNNLVKGKNNLILKYNSVVINTNFRVKSNDFLKKYNPEVVEI